MADPISIVSMGASIAGGAISAFGAKKSGESQQQMFNYQAGVAKINSDIDKQNQEYALSQGEAEAAR